MATISASQHHPATLTERIQGRAELRILREFATYSGIFPLFNAIRIITTEGFASFFSDPANYVIFAASGIQAIYLGSRTSYRWWERAAGNLIAPTLYTAVDVLFESPAEFWAAPYHYVFWIYALGMALLCLIESASQRLQAPMIIGMALWRVALFPALYIVSELGEEFSGPLNWPSFVSYWNSSSGHSFIVLAALLFGFLLGLSEAEVSRTTIFLRRVAARLKEFSEWSLEASLLETSIDDQTALGQRRAERIVLFADIRGFTSWSESRDPETVVAMLNRFYELAETIVMENGGHKPHFIGDEVMTWFDNPQAAIDSARQLRLRAAELLAEFNLAAGIGLHLGDVVEGLMGSGGTRSYNIIGDAVNTTARLCAAANAGEILISDAVARRLRLSPEQDALRVIQAKGKSEPLKAYRG